MNNNYQQLFEQLSCKIEQEGLSVHPDLDNYYLGWSHIQISIVKVIIVYYDGTLKSLTD